MPCHKPEQVNDMSAERIEVKTGWIPLKIRVGMASVATWVRGADIARISTISMPGVAGNAGTSQVEMEGGGNGQVVDHSPAEIIEAIKACERCTGLCECGTCKTPDLSEGEGLQPDGSYVIKVRAGESALCVSRRHPNVMRVESGGVVVEPGPPGRVVRIISR